MDLITAKTNLQHLYNELFKINHKLEFSMNDLQFVGEVGHNEDYTKSVSYGIKANVIHFARCLHEILDRVHHLFYKLFANEGNENYDPLDDLDTELGKIFNLNNSDLHVYKKRVSDLLRKLHGNRLIGEIKGSKIWEKTYLNFGEIDIEFESGGSDLIPSLSCQLRLGGFRILVEDLTLLLSFIKKTLNEIMNQLKFFNVRDFDRLSKIVLPSEIYGFVLEGKEVQIRPIKIKYGEDDDSYYMTLDGYDHVYLCGSNSYETVPLLSLFRHNQKAKDERTDLCRGNRSGYCYGNHYSILNDNTEAACSELVLSDPQITDIIRVLLTNMGTYSIYRTDTKTYVNKFLCQFMCDLQKASCLSICFDQLMDKILVAYRSIKIEIPHIIEMYDQLNQLTDEYNVDFINKLLSTGAFIHHLKAIDKEGVSLTHLMNMVPVQKKKMVTYRPEWPQCDDSILTDKIESLIG
jgi:hypothetical protein